MLSGYITKDVLAIKPAIKACSAESLLHALRREHDTNYKNAK